MSLLEEITAESNTLQEELELAQSRIEDLKAKAGQAQQLRDRLLAIEPEARVAGELRQKFKELDHKIRNTNAAMAQEVHHWKGRFEQEEESRQIAEALAAKRSSEINQLKVENQRLSQEVQEMPGRISAKVWAVLKPLKQELEELRQLKVWVGHPYRVCGKQPLASLTGKQSPGYCGTGATVTETASRNGPGDEWNTPSALRPTSSERWWTGYTPGIKAETEC